MGVDSAMFREGLTRIAQAISGETAKLVWCARNTSN